MRYALLICLVALLGCQKEQPRQAQQWPQQPPQQQWQQWPQQPPQQTPPSIVEPPRMIEGAYKGPWRTTNRRLDGIMTAEVKNLGGDNWRGRFYGIWQGVDFDYTVTWTGPPEGLTGTAVIDNADYRWTGTIIGDRFKGAFTGSRYTGWFDLKRQ